MCCMRGSRALHTALGGQGSCWPPWPPRPPPSIREMVYKFSLGNYDMNSVWMFPFALRFCGLQLGRQGGPRRAQAFAQPNGGSAARAASVRGSDSAPASPLSWPPPEAGTRQASSRRDGSSELPGSGGSAGTTMSGTGSACRNGAEAAGAGAAVGAARCAINAPPARPAARPAGTPVGAAAPAGGGGRPLPFVPPLSGGGGGAAPLPALFADMLLSRATEVGTGSRLQLEVIVPLALHTRLQNVRLKNLSFLAKPKIGIFACFFAQT